MTYLSLLRTQPKPGTVSFAVTGLRSLCLQHYIPRHNSQFLGHSWNKTNLLSSGMPCTALITAAVYASAPSCCIFGLLWIMPWGQSSPQLVHITQSPARNSASSVFCRQANSNAHHMRFNSDNVAGLNTAWPTPKTKIQHKTKAYHALHLAKHSVWVFNKQIYLAWSLLTCMLNRIQNEFVTT